MPKIISIKEVNENLKAINSEYECTFYDGRSSPDSLFIHLKSKTGPLPSRYSKIIIGRHPSWSPACKRFQVLDINIANQRLREANVEYECVMYDGYDSPNSLFVHAQSKTGPLPSVYSSVLKGSHPSWSPSCKKIQVLDINIANQRLKAANSEYECTKYAGAKSPNSLFVHIPSKTSPKKARYDCILRGQHPKWSPAYEKQKKERSIKRTLTLEEVNENLKGANVEYRCVKYVSARSSNSSLFVHLPSKTGPLPSRYSSILKGQHPSWSPTKKNINRIDPSNDKLCTIYFCKTKTYGKGRGGRKLWNNGPYLTIGVTTGNTKSRYRKNGLIKTYFEFETYNCNIHEKSLLNQITALLGQPDAGTEAWKWSQNREDITRKLFLDHFLKDYIENI